MSHPVWTSPELPARRRGPSAWWWVAGGLSLLAAVALVVAIVVSLVAPMFRTEAHIVGDDGQSLVEVESGRDYLIWADLEGPVPTCAVTDAFDGERVPVEGMGNTSLTRNDQDATGWFEAPSDRVMVGCTGAGDVEIGPRPHAPEWLGGLAGTILVPALLALAGIAILLVTTVRALNARR